MTNQKPKFLKKVFKLTDWWPNGLGIAHFKCIKCGEQIGLGGFFSRPPEGTKMVYPCHKCTSAHYATKGLRIRYQKGVGQVLEPLPVK
jgi:hypothetical protein